MKETTKNILSIILGVPLLIGVFTIFIYNGWGKSFDSIEFANGYKRCTEVGYEEKFDEEGGASYSVALRMFTSKEKKVKCYKSKDGKPEISDFITLKDRLLESGIKSPADRRCKELGFLTSKKVYDSKSNKEIKNEALFDKNSMVICRLESSYEIKSSNEQLSKAYTLYNK